MNRILVSMIAGCALLAGVPSAAQIASPVPAHAPALDRPVARVNGAVLTERDILLEMEILFPYYSVHGGGVPPKVEQDIRAKAFDRVVLQELLYQEAKRRGLRPSTQALEQRIARARRQFSSHARFETAVIDQQGSMREFRRRALRARMAEMLWEQEVLRPSRVTEAELRSYFQQHRKKYVRPESVRLQTISFQFAEQGGPEARRAARARAEEILGQAADAKTFEAFGALAERVSTDDWRVMQGDHGWMHRGTIAPELELAFQMKPGEISGITESPSGFHILRVHARRPASPMSFAQVREALRKTLEESRLTERRNQFEIKLRSRARIEKL